MVHLDELYCHTAELYGLFGLNYVESNFSVESLFSELAFDETDREPCSVYGDVYLFQEISESADVVLVAVSDNDSAELVAVAFNISKIRDNDVYTGHISVRESKTAVENEHIVRALENCHILAYLIETAERYYPDGSMFDLFWLSCALGRCRNSSCFGL